MSTYGVEIPYPEPYDARQEQRDHELEAIRTSLDWGEIRLQILQKIASDMLAHEGPIGEVTEQLEAAPITHQWDLESWLRWCGPRDAHRLGKALMRHIGEAVMGAWQAADDRPF